MTDEQMRIAIAEALGYTHVRIIKDIEGPPDAGIGHHPTKPHSVPDYLNDLNAMHEAEKTFADDDVIAEKYWLALYDATEHTRWPYDATSRQRCIAFLKTLNLWKDYEQ